MKKDISYRKIPKKNKKGFYTALVGYEQSSLEGLSDDEINALADAIPTHDERLESRLAEYEKECREVLADDLPSGKEIISGDIAILQHTFDNLSNKWLAADVLSSILDIRALLKLQASFPDRVQVSEIAFTALRMERAYMTWNFIEHDEYDVLAHRGSVKGGKKSGAGQLWYIKPLQEIINVTIQGLSWRGIRKAITRNYDVSESKDISRIEYDNQTRKINIIPRKTSIEPKVQPCEIIETTLSGNFRRPKEYDN